VINFGWVFFRVDKIKDAIRYIKHMLLPQKGYEMCFDNEFFTWLIIAVFFSFFAFGKRGQKLQDELFLNPYGNLKHASVALAAMLLFILSVSSITASGFNPFIYFRF
jgi:alginate O-acetyltransferase complex protein AlgI